MITLVSASNRSQNNTQIFANYVFDLLKGELKENVQILNMTGVSPCSLSAVNYKKEDQPQELKDIQERYFLPADKFWFFVPEYNGSFPGMLKTLLDMMSVNKLSETFNHKKACITGTASGRAGNLRGMDHLSDILNHLEVTVMPNKLPISSIHKLIDQDQKLVHGETIKCLAKQAQEFVAF